MNAELKRSKQKTRGGDDGGTVGTAHGHQQAHIDAWHRVLCFLCARITMYRKNSRRTSSLHKNDLEYFFFAARPWMKEIYIDSLSSHIATMLLLYAMRRKHNYGWVKKNCCLPMFREQSYCWCCTWILFRTSRKTDPYIHDNDWI